MCIKDSINKTCWKNGKDLSNRAPKIKLWNHTKKTHFPVFAKNFRRPCMKLKFFFCQFPNPWTLRVSGMGGYTSKCEKKSKSLHPNVQWCNLDTVWCYSNKKRFPFSVSEFTDTPRKLNKKIKIISWHHFLKSHRRILCTSIGLNMQVNDVLFENMRMLREHTYSFHLD
jgi:hypothetical protein